MGMIAVGVLGAPMLGALQDQKLDQAMSNEQPAIYAQVARPPQTFPLIRGVDTGVTAIGPFRPLDQSRIAALPENERSAAGAVIAEHKQRTLLRFAVLPTLMALAYAACCCTSPCEVGTRRSSSGAATDRLNAQRFETDAFSVQGRAFELQLRCVREGWPDDLDGCEESGGAETSAKREEGRPDFLLPHGRREGDRRHRESGG
jgi:hypothetical protein